MFKDLSLPEIQPAQIDPETNTVNLSEDLQNQLNSIFETEENFSCIGATTSVVKPDNNFVFFSNQWFYIAVLCKKYACALYEYCEFFDEHIRNDQELINEIISGSCNNSRFTNLFNSESDRNWMIRFILADQQYRPGKALLNRQPDNNQVKVRSCKDIFGSCVLKKVSVPDASSAYLGNIIYYLAKNPNIYDNLEIAICNTVCDFDYNMADAGGMNLVVYGTPGCGKSYYVDHDILGKSADGTYSDYKSVIRTTFYQDYSNTDFVGQVMPVITTETDENGKEEQIVTYRFVPGPFTLALECAIANPTEKVALVIEELNRGNAPSIFGDLFQLLDRIDKDDNNKRYPIGTSEYGIKNVNILNYLSDNTHYDKDWVYSFNLKEVRIPANLYIYATMNTSDQNVFTLDTAFKRRWEFEKLKNVFSRIDKDGNQVDHSYKDFKVPILKCTWQQFVDGINKFITSDTDSLSAEDKQLGVYFVSEKLLYSSDKESATEEQTKKFAYKVFEYLWDDVAKFSRDKWFKKELRTLDDVIDNFVEGKQVFTDDVIKSINDANKQS